MKIRQLETLMEIEKVEEESEVVLRFPEPYGVFDTNENLISVKDVSFAWPDEKPLFSKVDFCVVPRSRLAILGKNGCGEHLTSLII
jgi:ATPase subunit of ABC transporter with duplicated ATPase domains